jgi:hypothetical protein
VAAEAHVANDTIGNVKEDLDFVQVAGGGNSPLLRGER